MSEVTLEDRISDHLHEVREFQGSQVTPQHVAALGLTIAVAAKEIRDAIIGHRNAMLELKSAHFDSMASLACDVRTLGQTLRDLSQVVWEKK